MSTYYAIYAEGRIKDDNGNESWKLLDPYVHDIKEDKYKIATTYESFSRSYFGEAYDKLREFSLGTPPFEELSSDLQTRFSFIYKAKDEEDSFWSAYQLFRVDFKEIEEIAKDDIYTYHSFVNKDELFKLETEGMYPVYPGEIQEDDDLFFKLTPEERDKLYTYKEWDNPDDWLYHFKRIKKAVHSHANDFSAVNWDSEITGIRLIVYMD